MILESWENGLFAGMLFSIAGEALVRTIARRLREKKIVHCTNCDGRLREDGRAEYPIEELEVCGICGDSWQMGCRDADISGENIAPMSAIVNAAWKYERAKYAPSR